jgi:hypothetical protein
MSNQRSESKSSISEQDLKGARLRNSEDIDEEDDFCILEAIREHYSNVEREEGGTHSKPSATATNVEEEDCVNDLKKKANDVELAIVTSSCLCPSVGVPAVAMAARAQASTTSKAETKVSCEGGGLESLAVETEPPACSVAMADESLPGAYAMRPSPEATPMSSLGSEGISQLCADISIATRSVTDSQEDQALVSARAVEEGHIQRADPMISSRKSGGNEHVDSCRFHSRLLCVTAFCSTIAVGISALICSLRHDEVAFPTPSPLQISNPPSPAPTSFLEYQVLSLLPKHTLIELQDSLSPQSKALKWILEDPQLPIYIESEWRVQQRFALASFYHSTGGANWTYDDHWLSYEHHECDWFARPHFTFEVPFVKYPRYEQEGPCGDDSDGKLQHLWMYNNDLQGSLPEEVYLLTNLRSVSLFDNFLSGTLSSRIGELRQLEAISLDKNEAMGGSLPSELGQLSSTLWSFTSHGMELTGSIPSEIGRLSLMETLLLDLNHLTGTIPSEIGNLSELTVWYGSVNRLTGSLPSELGLLESLVDCHLDFNLLTGTVSTQIHIKPEFFRLTNVVPVHSSSLLN